MKCDQLLDIIGEILEAELPTNLGNLMDAFDYALIWNGPTNPRQAEVGKNYGYILYTKDGSKLATFDLDKKKAMLGDGYEKEMEFYKNDLDSQNGIKEIISKLAGYFKLSVPDMKHVAISRSNP